MAAEGSWAHLRDLDAVSADELRHELRRTVFQEHLDDLTEIGAKFFDARTLRVGSGPPGDVAYVERRLCIPFDDSNEVFHVGTLARFDDSTRSALRSDARATLERVHGDGAVGPTYDAVLVLSAQVPPDGLQRFATPQNAAERLNGLHCRGTVGVAVQLRW